MPEIAEAQAVLAALAERDEVKAAIAQRERRLHLQTSYGQAILYSRGFATKETQAVFARAAGLATKSGDFSERFAAAHGLWTTAWVRCELRAARDQASAFLREAENLRRLMEAGVARRGLALINYCLGNFLEAHTHCERALDLCDPQRDQEARERFGDDTGTLALSLLAETSWHLGEVERARELIDAARGRATKLGHFPSMGHPLYWRWTIEIWRGDLGAALAAAEALAVLGQESGMSPWRALGEIGAAWARGRLYDPAVGATELRRTLGALADQGVSLGVPFYKALLAELEAETLGPAIALGRIDEALALADRLEYRCALSFMHRIRGDILLKLDPANPAPPEDAYRSAIAVANEQGARSPHLQAALALATLYRSTNRAADAQAVLAPAVEGFSPTPEMPEIAEAQALLESLARGGEEAIASKDQATRVDGGWPRL
jgi:tetratricopeptide (TPR) repeat protein